MDRFIPFPKRLMSGGDVVIRLRVSWTETQCVASRLDTIPISACSKMCQRSTEVCLRALCGGSSKPRCRSRVVRYKPECLARQRSQIAPASALGVGLHQQCARLRLDWVPLDRCPELLHCLSRSSELL